MKAALKPLTQRAAWKSLAAHSKQIKTLGFNQPLYILPFDHRGSFETKMFGWHGDLNAAQTIRELQDTGVEPDVWKIEGLDRRADCENVPLAHAVAANGSVASFWVAAKTTRKSTSG